jgi:methionine-rich copper-binding protein CopC
LRKLLLLPILAALIALASASTVSAHSRPRRFDPGPGAILTKAPSEVTGWFSSDIRAADDSFIHVQNSDGEDVHTGDVKLSTDRRQMTAALQSGLGDGKYLVIWSTFDDVDGEVFSGCYTFFVGQSAADDAIANGDPMDGGADCPFNVEEPDPATAPSIELSMPEVVSGTSATLTITPTNFTPRAPDGSSEDPAFGHYHIYLDKVPVDVIAGEDHSHDAAGATGASGSTGGMADMTGGSGGMVENPAMSVSNSFTFTDLEPGVHTVAVSLTYDDHTPFNPPVIASTSFRVQGSDSGSSGIPTWALILGVIAGLVIGGVGMKLVGSRA